MAPMRRKSHGSIRSPHVKRDSQSQVIMEGWLYKLEGAALKQFKQRWCVLADFCLFFYKGPNEEKTTSSILLPSYKISPCTSEDKVSKKFSFKAEHLNMKTYYFAAEDMDSMKKWMNAMSLASIMQNFVRSEKYDTTFSSASNDDEDSGFTSYRSKRYTSQKLNTSTSYDPNFGAGTEPLKQRSNSYGDRMGEVYLGSGDKYPNDKYHSNAPCQNPPRRQPLYANAPPKPRRLTQSDSYGLYSKDCYDQEVAAIEASRFYGKQPDSMYPEHQKIMQYYQQGKDIHSDQEQYDPTIISSSMQYTDNFPQEVPDLYRNQPPRPRSADFLEREAECAAVPDVTSYPERRQPQRPKSSLEYYDRYVDYDDGNFDYYREAVRIQADNLYANKNARKRQSPRPQYDPKAARNYVEDNQHSPRTQYDQKVGGSYIGDNQHSPRTLYDQKAGGSYVEDNQQSYQSQYDPKVGGSYVEDNNNYVEQVSPCYGSFPAKEQSRYDNSVPPSSQTDHLQPAYAKPVKVKEESMQRLLEWKQRMLQSPLTKRNHVQSTSSANSSLTTSPMKMYQQQKVFREPQMQGNEMRTNLEFNDSRYPGNSPRPNDYMPKLDYSPRSKDYPPRSKDYMVRSHSASPQRQATEPTRRLRNDSTGSQRQATEARNLLPSFSNIEKICANPNMDEPKTLDSRVDIPVENLYKDKVMYCVDSENNEILFSYEDTSPTTGAPHSLQTCHYPPQMQSFSTMHNVSNIGSDSQSYNKYEDQGLGERREEMNTLPRSSQGYKGPSSVPQRQRHTTYSSDDEDGGQKGKEHQPDSEGRVDQSDLGKDADQVDCYRSSSPDYVNIGAICDDYVHQPYATNTSCKVNQAFLKPLHQVSKKCKALPEPVDNPISATESQDSDVYYQQTQKDQFDTGSRNNSMHNQVSTSYGSKQKQNEKAYQSDVSSLNGSIQNQNVTSYGSIKDEHKPKGSGYQYDTSSLNDSLQNQSFTSYSSSKGGYESETEFDIKREDYYRASQIFYASTRGRNKQGVSKRQREVRRSSVLLPEKVSCPAAHSYSNVVLSGSLSSLDKDVGLPLPKSPYKSPTSNREPDVVENIASSQKHPYKFSAEEEQSVPRKYMKLDPEQEVMDKDPYGKLHIEKPCVDVPNSKQEAAGKKLTYEEMRGQLLRKREAPPPNIVQDRIKKFETVDTVPKESKIKTPEPTSKSPSNSENLPSSESGSMRSIGKKNRNKLGRSKSYRQSLHSDSEVVPFEESENSSDDLTLKSAPILLSPLSSVLADLRMTAESGKEQSPPKETSANQNASTEYFLEMNALQSESIKDPVGQFSKSSSSKKVLKYEEHHRRSVEEVEYLPMFGSKQVLEEQEPEYVMMGGSKLSPGVKDKKFFVEENVEEHVYNEPFSPPPSFLHDVYEKQKTKQFQFLKSSSSEDSLTENIYEKPIHRFPSSRNLRNETVQETNSILMSSLSCSNVTSIGRGTDFQKTPRYVSERNIPSRSNFHQYEQANISVSVPDLLQLKDMKDSDASDADDEASRDFDTAGEMRHPSYQAPILDQFPGVSMSHQDTSFELELMAFNRSVGKDPKPFAKVSKTEVKPLPTYEALYNVATYPQQPCAQSTLKAASMEKSQLPKLRVYTRGKKPEVPKLPFDLEESEICGMGKKDSTKTEETASTSDVHITDSSGTTNLDSSGMTNMENLGLFNIDTSGMPSLDSSIAIDSDSLSENVAYGTRREVTPLVASTSMPSSSSLSHSYRPDVVPTVQEDSQRVPNEKYSPSKSPNSAPYYYSDLLSGQGVNLFGQVPLFKRGDVPYLEKTSPPKSNPSLLNNVRSSSPSCKGDIGRKVNKINSKCSIATTKDAINEKMKYWKAESAKNNVKSSVDNLEKSKYLDAERNKYEAGHTLEKTRSSSTMSYFKHRASTPELNSCQHQSEEPVYENLVFQKPKLQKQRSHSLERFPNSETVTSVEEDRPSSPVYENLEFFNLETKTLREQTPVEMRHKERIKTPEHSELYHIETKDLNDKMQSQGKARRTDSSKQYENYNIETKSLQDSGPSQGNVGHKERMENPEQYEFQEYEQESSTLPLKIRHKEIMENSERCRQVITSHTSMFAERQYCNAVNAVPPVQKTDVPHVEADFLDQNVLRRVSKQHFFGKNLKNPPAEKCASTKNFPLQNSEVINYGEAKDEVMMESVTSKFSSGHGIEIYDSDSSGSTSSCDEASVVSDNRYQISSNKIRASDLTRSASSEIHVGEPNHLKKLVQQSEGLMCKGKRLSVSAGDLLGKTHEELVLLLIQLRRNQAKILKSKDKLEQQMKNLKEFNQSHPGKHSYQHNKKDLAKQIQLLERQYDVTHPLVALVDNMIKLGSLYGSSHRRSFSLPLLDTSQEELSLPPKAAQSPDHFGESSILTKLLADESSFQKRISEIYSLDKGLRHETNSITSLHQDKEMLEYTLSGMRNKILDHQDRPSELQKLKKQQKMIEKELMRVKKLLSTSAKKIEDAASKNDQMEKDILYLRHILKEALKTGSTETKSSQHNRADIEAELSRVQNVLDELANHRHEINNTVIKLKGEAPPTIAKEVEFRASPSGTSDEKETTHLKKVKKGVEVRASPTGVAGSAPLPVRKKQHSMYLETDLDTLVTRDLAMLHEKDLDDTPVYANAEEMNNPPEEIYENLNTFDSCSVPYSLSDGLESCSMQDINDADERMKRFYGILPKEKPSEIKTVRIVKRQSERRNRERDKKRVTYDDQSSVWVVDEPDLSSDDLLELEEVIPKGPSTVATRPSSIHLLTSSLNRQSNSQSAHERLFGNAANKTEKSFSTGSQSRAYSTKRTKRRHYTVSGYQYVLDPQFAQYFKDRPRSRDDVDMERCLRTANTPDIVRSTIKKKEVFDDRIIDQELMLPPKIEIPERYVEIEPEELSAKEKLQRSIKAENICKMLSETTTSYEDVVEERSKSPDAIHKKLSEEKRKRAHLLNLNRAIAREVVEKSKAVAGKC
ncbi:hypothetical protein JTE90_004193 [Oedothorax gibbosus]|uniref:PH domain-containing protein n=1 Tax=Oedothorax gibbosus TaxID=931172 RepID=A0AAV6US59_9ARAC|nr:hypothetical protein JTE90_004193 [Oedothorax gibbosus]